MDEKQLQNIDAMISSMTPKERRNPKIIYGRRRKRIADGSGSSVQDINKLLKMHEQMKEMMKMLQKMSGGKGMKGMKPPRMPGGMPPGLKK